MQIQKDLTTHSERDTAKSASAGRRSSVALMGDALKGVLGRGASTKTISGVGGSDAESRPRSLTREKTGLSRRASIAKIGVAMGIMKRKSDALSAPPPLESSASESVYCIVDDPELRKQPKSGASLLQSTSEDTDLGDSGGWGARVGRGVAPPPDPREDVIDKLCAKMKRKLPAQKDRREEVTVDEIKKRFAECDEEMDELVFCEEMGLYLDDLGFWQSVFPKLAGNKKTINSDDLFSFLGIDLSKHVPRPTLPPAAEPIMSPARAGVQSGGKAKRGSVFDVFGKLRERRPSLSNPDDHADELSNKELLRIFEEAGMRGKNLDVDKFVEIVQPKVPQRSKAELRALFEQMATSDSNKWQTGGEVLRWDDFEKYLQTSYKAADKPPPARKMTMEDFDLPDSEQLAALQNASLQQLRTSPSQRLKYDATPDLTGEST